VTAAGTPPTASTVVLWYDDLHTPPAELRARVGDALLLAVDIGAGPAFSRDAWFAVHEVDATREFAAEYLLRAIRADAIYQGGYLLSAALSRPLLATVCARVAAAAGASTLVHGLTGNDQLRLEMGLRALSPRLCIRSVATLLDDAADGLHGSNASDGIGARRGDDFTVSENLWGRSVESGVLGDIAVHAPPEVLGRSVHPRLVTAPPEVHTLSFTAGRPTHVDGVALDLHQLIRRLDELAGPFGIGVRDMVEDGFVGLKTRAVYEAPGATVLVEAHRDLRRLVCSRRQNDAVDAVSRAWADLVYDGFWFDPARESLEALLADVNRWVEGEIDLLFTAGAVHPVGRRTPFALYAEDEAVYRVGQDLARTYSTSTSIVLSGPMRAAQARGCRRPEGALVPREFPA
jgi:argininosuccinate synthase